MIVHIGQLLIVIGAIWAWWGNWGAVGLAVAFLVLCVAQLAFLGDTEEPGGWINGLHGMLALVHPPRRSVVLRARETRARARISPDRLNRYRIDVAGAVSTAPALRWRTGSGSRTALLVARGK